MALTSNDQKRIRDYLLGKLSEDEQQTIEERLIAEDDLFQELEISKSELVEDYRANDLSTAEKQWLESHFLASPEGKETYELTLSLDHLARSPPTRLPSVSFFERLQTSLKQYRWAG